MADFEFDKKRIEQDTIGIGVDVRPPIELSLDVLRIQEFYNQVSDQFPNLFADLSQSKTEFRINKKIPIPGKGEVSVATFTLTQRGPVFNFPITLPGVLDGYEWSKTLNEHVIKCLETFHRHMPGTKFVRIGKVRKLVFHCEGIDGNEFFRGHFLPHAPESSEELTVAWNDPDEDFNRRLAAKVAGKAAAAVPPPLPSAGFCPAGFPARKLADSRRGAPAQTSEPAQGRLPRLFLSAPVCRK